MYWVLAIRLSNQVMPLVVQIDDAMVTTILHQFWFAAAQSLQAVLIKAWGVFLLS